MHSKSLMLTAVVAFVMAASGRTAGAEGTDKAREEAAIGKELANLAWKAGTPTPFQRVESPTVVVDGKMFLFGGFTDDLGASTELDVYDPASDTWARRKEMPTGVTHLNPAIDGNNIWLAGGFKGKHPGPVTDEVWKYDIAEDHWTPGPRLPEPRAGGGLAIEGRKLHYFGGFKSDRNTDAVDHWSLPLDGGTAWEKEPDMPHPRGHLAAAVLDGKLYALGGTQGHDATQIDLPYCEVYDPAAKAWREIKNLPEGGSHFESSTLIYQGGILLVGGRVKHPDPSERVLNDLMFYDPKADTWSLVGTLPEKVLAPSAAIIGDRLVVTGGGLNNPRPLTAATWVAPIPVAK